MVKEGYYFGLPPLALGAAALLLRWTVAGVILLCLAAFVFYFFRDPERVIPADAGAVVSPADGRVVVVTDEDNAGRPGKRISIFLAIWNVHVNRSPADGVITNLRYCPGKFSAAMRESASTDNEQNVITLATDAGEITFKQIAGLIARRVVCWKKVGRPGPPRRTHWPRALRVPRRPLAAARFRATGESRRSRQRGLQRCRLLADAPKNGAASRAKTSFFGRKSFHGWEANLR